MRPQFCWLWLYIYDLYHMTIKKITFFFFCLYRWLFKLSEWAHFSSYDVGIQSGSSASHILVYDIFHQLPFSFFFNNWSTFIWYIRHEFMFQVISGCTNLFEISSFALLMTVFAQSPQPELEEKLPCLLTNIYQPSTLFRYYQISSLWFSFSEESK